jgi:WD40 repeat protein
MKRSDGNGLTRYCSGRAHAIALSFHADQLASVYGDRLVIYDTSTSEVTREFTLQDGSPRAIAFSPDGQLVGITSGSQITVLDLQSGKERELTGDLGSVAAASVSPSGQYVAIASRKRVRLWDGRTGRAVALLEWHEYVTGVLFDPRERWLAIAGYHTISIFSLNQLEDPRRFALTQAEQEKISEIAVTPDGAQIFARNTAGSLIMIDVQTGNDRILDNLGRDAVDTMAISPDGQWIATGGQDLRVRRLADGSLIATHAMNRRVKSLAWSPDCSSIIAGGDGGVYSLLFSNRPA